MGEEVWGRHPPPLWGTACSRTMCGWRGERGNLGGACLLQPVGQGVTRKGWCAAALECDGCNCLLLYSTRGYT